LPTTGICDFETSLEALEHTLWIVISVDCIFTAGIE
jgi:hypothetical protein